MAGEDQPLTEYEKQRLARIRENEARLEALGIRRLAASPLLNQPSSAAAAAGAKRKQKKRSDDADEEYLPSDGGGGGEEEEEESSSAGDQDFEEEFKASSRSNQKVSPFSGGTNPLIQTLESCLYHRCTVSMNLLTLLFW